MDSEPSNPINPSSSITAATVADADTDSDTDSCSSAQTALHYWPEDHKEDEKEDQSVMSETDNAKEKERKKQEEKKVDQELAALIASLNHDLLCLNIQAQEQLYTYRHSTQVALCRETSELYKKYKQHGSMVRFSSALLEFLSPPRMTRGSSQAGHIDYDTNVNNVNPNCQQEQKEEEGPGINPHTQKPPYATEPAFTPIVASLGFFPADIKLSFPAHLAMPIEVPWCINNILLLQNSIAQAKLRHHTAKYCLPWPHPWSGQIEPGRRGANAHPHILPLFRLAILEPLQHQLSTMFTGQSPIVHPLALPLESVKILRQAYEEKSGACLPLEYMFLAKAARVDEEIVREWWRQEDHARRAEKMMMIWVAARELERKVWYKQRAML